MDLKIIKGGKKKQGALESKSEKQQELDRILLQSNKVVELIIYRLSDKKPTPEPLLLVPLHKVTTIIQEIYIRYKRAGYRGKKVTSGTGNNYTVFVALHRKNTQELIVVYAEPARNVEPKYTSLDEIQDTIEPFDYWHG